MREPHLAQRACGAPRGGFTLTELLVTVIVAGIVASAALPQYGRAVERGRWRAARDIVSTIYSGEQVYMAQNETLYPTAASQGLGPGSDWSPIFMDDPNTGPSPVEFGVTVEFGGTRYGAACRDGVATCATRISIDLSDGTFDPAGFRSTWAEP